MPAVMDGKQRVTETSQVSPLDYLVRSIRQIDSLTDEDADILRRIVESKDYKKGQFLTRQGQIENYVYFVAAGIVRNYLVQDGEDLTFDIFFPGSFTNAFTSFIIRDKAQVSVQALTPVNVLRLHFSKLKRLYDHSLYFNRLGRKIAEFQYIRRTRREISFVSQTPKERYEALLSGNPVLVQQIPLKYLATYLGIKPETLSRIRKSRTVSKRKRLS